MRTVAGWGLSVLGLAVAVLGVALMVVLGPDSRVTTGPHAIETDGSVVVTAPRVITWSGVQVDVLAEVPAQKPVFIGLGNTVDVQSLVAGTQRLEITKFDTPWKPTTKQRDGRATVQGAPTSLDWWFADSAGLGGASISTSLPGEPVSLAVVSVGASNLSGLQVTLAYGIKGGFAKGAGLLLLGLGALVAGTLVRRGARSGGARSAGALTFEGADGDEEIVYLIVDEDGVERELTAEEVATGGYEVVEEDEPEPEAEPEPGPEPERGPDQPTERVVYVFVDEDGVEHEVGEDELDDFEIVDDDEPDGEGEKR